MLTRLGADLVPVPVDHDGLVVDALPGGARVPRLLVVTPSHQYPLGGRLPVERRLALLDWASRHDVVIAEDDYDSEFRFDVAPLAALAALDSNGRVVHLGTFSKVLTPWLRAGYLVAPPWLLPALREVRHDLATPVSGTDQQALAAYLAAGALRRHIARSRRDYAHARAHLTRRLAPHAPRIRLRGTNAGLHAVLELPPGTDIHSLLEHCLDRGVLLTTLADYDVTPRRRPCPTVVLGYGDATLAQLDQAVDALLTGLDDHN